MTLGLLGQVNKADILAELNFLQERCSSLALALADSLPTKLGHQDGYAFVSPTLLHDRMTMSASPDHSSLSPGTSISPIGPGGWGELSAGGLNDNLMDQTSQTSFGHALPMTGVLGSESFLVDQDTLSEDYLQLDALLGNNCDSGFQDVFDFNAASLPQGSDVDDGVATAAGMAAENEPTINPTLPSIPKAMSDPDVGTLVANSVQSRRHHCPSCMRTFRRRSDRNRHTLVHNPNAPRYGCSFPGCDRVGNRGFLRKDKLTQHQDYRRH